MITVFTPAYNRAHLIHRVYDSLKAQTYREFEWIIVDDGSSDNTEEVVKGYMVQDNFFDIRYFYQTNQGKHMATNRAVQEARGELFITIDSDDGCKPQDTGRHSVSCAENIAVTGCGCKRGAIRRESKLNRRSERSEISYEKTAYYRLYISQMGKGYGAQVYTGLCKSDVKVL